MSTAVSGIVVAAYQCGPGMGSVSQIGWEWYRRLAARRPVTLVTHVRNRAAIDAAPDRPHDADIVYIDTEWLAAPLFRFAKRLFPRSEHGVFMVASLDFFAFDLQALRTLRRLRPQRNWSLVHVVTPVTLAAPSRLHRLGLPVVRGPLNCGLESPAGFPELLRHEPPWLIRLRGLPTQLDALIGASRGCSAILTATRATRAAVASRHQARCVDMVENGVDLPRFPPAEWPAAPGPQEPLRILFVGRMIALKGGEMLLAAAARLVADGMPVAVTLVGDGPERHIWEARAASLGISGMTRFTGALDAAGVAAEMRHCHIFCLPSVRESGGAVLLEAMACARPVITIAHGGPAELADDEVGCLIPATDTADVTRRLADAFAAVVADPSGWAARGRRGRQRIEAKFDWERKVTAAEALYARITDNCGDFAVASQSTGAAAFQ
jgi:glycosyltransferase involved in cell wall biosynthesis